MSFEQICVNIVKTLNNVNIPKNNNDWYCLEFWYEDAWKIRPIIYHHGGRCTDKGFGAIFFVKAGNGEENRELAYKKLVKDYLIKKYEFKEDFDTYEEMMLKLEIRGIDFKEGII